MNSKLKFGISYNVFDGEELLEDSILQIREFVDFISVVYQKTSNHGNQCSLTLEKTINKLIKDKLIDSTVEYVPINSTPHVNEINKRNIGVNLSRNWGCTHHMTIDCDEFYEKKQFENLINWYNENPNSVGFCGLINYYKDSSLQMELIDNTNVSLFFPLSENREYVMNYPTPVLIDPTRKPNCNNTHVFSSDIIVMHHMTMVRRDIAAKLINSSARINYLHTSIPDIVSYYNKFNPEKDLIGFGIQGKYGLKKITPIIKLEKYYLNG